MNLILSYLWTAWMTNNIHRDTIDRALGYTSSNKVKEFNSCKLTSHPQVPPLMRDVLYLTAVLNRSYTFYIQCWIGTEFSNPWPWLIQTLFELCILGSHWREAKKSNREEKEKFDILFSNFEKRKRNLKFLSPVSRGEREIWKKVLHFREEKEKGVFFSQVSRGERELF